MKCLRIRLSNQEFGALIEQLEGLVPRPDERLVPQRPRTTRQTMGYRAVERSCLRALKSVDEPMTLRGIHEAVESALGTTVSYSSVKNAVARLAKAHDRRAHRLAPGVYCIGTD